MKAKTVFGATVILATVISFVLVLGGSVSAQEKIQIGTAPAGGTYYVMGAGMAEILTRWGGFKATAQVTGGGTQNCRLIEAGEINMATVAGQQLSLSAKGEAPFTKKIDLRLGFYMYQIPLEIVVLDDSDIHSIYDLKGKKVAVGAMGSGIEGKSKAIFGLHGLTYDQFTPVYQGGSKGTDALGDGILDASVQMGHPPTPAVTSISLVKKVRLLEIDKKMLDTIVKELPFLSPFTLPANTYKNQPKSIILPAEINFVAFSPKMSDETAYKIVKTIYAHLDHLAKIHKAGSLFDINTASAFDIGVPYHPGAIKYYKEAGVWKR